MIPTATYEYARKRVMDSELLPDSLAFETFYGCLEARTGGRPYGRVLTSENTLYFIQDANKS